MRKDTNGDGKVSLPAAHTTRAKGECTGPAFSYSTYARGDKPSVKEVPLPARPKAKPKDKIDSANGCTADGETLEARYRGPCADGATCDQVFLVTALDDSNRRLRIGRGPARWAPSDSLRMEPCGGWKGVLSGLEVDEPHPGKHVQRPWRARQDKDNDCQDTVEELLIERSETPVRFETDKKCKVATGRWTCEYTGTVMTNRKDLVVEYVVPLDEAHATGGDWRDKGWRELFSNNTKNMVIVSKAWSTGRNSKVNQEWIPTNSLSASSFALGLG
ncbi:MAG: hypothetical protein GY811_29860 [Myxococcales bacterium]|nr:hypothetical protein [Myxococcales bacterium]